MTRGPRLPLTQFFCFVSHTQGPWGPLISGHSCWDTSTLFLKDLETHCLPDNLDIFLTNLESLKVRNSSLSQLVSELSQILKFTQYKETGLIKAIPDV